jgi:hypothetical protein
MKRSDFWFAMASCLLAAVIFILYEVYGGQLLNEGNILLFAILGGAATFVVGRTLKIKSTPKSRESTFLCIIHVSYGALLLLISFGTTIDIGTLYPDDTFAAIIHLTWTLPLLGMAFLAIAYGAYKMKRWAVILAAICDNILFLPFIMLSPQFMGLMALFNLIWLYRAYRLFD